MRQSLVIALITSYRATVEGLSPVSTTSRQRSKKVSSAATSSKKKKSGGVVAVSNHDLFSSLKIDGSNAGVLDWMLDEDAVVNADADAESMENLVRSLGIPSLKDGSGADVMAAEQVLQREASERRSKRGTRKKVGPPPVQKVRENLRLSHEEELELAAIIQQGAKVNLVKAEMEKDLGRNISKSEWSKAVGLPSPELRRLVSNYRSAKSKLVMANMGLVHAVVKGNRFQGGLRNAASYEELVQEGSLGLLRAAELFDPSRGLRFSTYATIWIKGVLGNTKVHELIVTPTRERTKVNKISAAANQLTELNENVTDEAIAEISGMTAEEVKDTRERVHKTRNLLSLDYTYTTSTGKGDARESTLYGDRALVDDYNSVETVALQADILSALTRNLKPREVELIRYRYGFVDGTSYTLQECADKMGLSFSRAQQLSVSCLKKLRKAEEAESLQEYLLTIV
eukprot:CAMPEP_0116006890 /NCGR_PEP_ID=MMETSP0321-20121206/1988_1 /TAXON_ID=163516 /ORGANISM="Leptocylindrus danicus var. danicus, Strain B650" /LENGTH=456 /DNA_ID=CAMNT_0003475511 /DNA_START=228 /DNA_END=1598 /DNA_ORIENTATION=-